MKKIVLLFILLVIVKLGYAQAPNWLWAITSESSGYYSYGQGVSVDNSGHLFISGRVDGYTTFGGSSVSPASLNPIIGEFDTAGNAIWLTSHYYSSGNDYPGNFFRDNRNYTYTTGIIGSSCCGMYVEKHNSSTGAIPSPWPVIFTGSSPSGFGVTADKQGYVYIVATCNSGTVTLNNSVTVNVTGGGQGGFVAKLDSNGYCIWAKPVNISGGNYAIPRDIILDDYGYLYFAGEYTGSPQFGTLSATTSVGVADFFVAKYDTSGNPISVNVATNCQSGVYNNPEGDTHCLAVDSCGNVYVTGRFQNTAQFGTLSITGTSNYNMFLAKCDKDFNWQWVTGGSSTVYNEGFGLAVDRYNEVYVGGDYSGNTDFGNGVTISGAGGIYVAKYSNSTGLALWAQTGLGSTSGHLEGFDVDRQGYVYVIGDYVGTAYFGTHSVTSNISSGIFLAKLDTVPPRYIIPTLTLNYCAGSTGTLNYTVIGHFNASNVFTAQLSDVNGSFVNAVDIGNITDTTSGSMSITIPSNAAPGSTYLIRVISSNPGTSSYVNGCGAYYQQNVYPNDFYITIGVGKSQALITASKDTTCNGVPVTLTASKGDSYLWNTSDTSRAITVNLIKDSTFTVTVNSGGCTGDTSITIKVDSSAKLDIEPQSPTICFGSSVTLFVKGGGANFVWTPGTGLSDTTGSSIIATPTGNITYTVTGNDSVGCVATGSNDVSVVPAPNKPTISASTDGDTLISSATQGNQWYFNDTLIVGATNQKLDISGKNKGWYTVTVINPANGCSATSDSTTGVNLLSSINEQLSIYPNPTTGSILITISSSVQDVGDWSLEVSDVLGRIVVTRPSLNHTTKIDLREFANGVYFIAVANKTGQAVFPVVKQN